MATTPRQRIVAILRSQTAKRIRFTAPARVGDVTIDQTTFETVAKAIDNARIKVTVQPRSAFAPGVTALYKSANIYPNVPYLTVPGFTSGELQTPPVVGRYEEGGVLHECTHAYFDLQSMDIGATNDEAISYVVDALYNRMTGLPGWRWGATVPGIYQASSAVADRLLHQYQLGRVDIPRVHDGTFQALRLQVAASPVYATGPAGLVNWIRPGMDSYVRDG